MSLKGGRFELPCRYGHRERVGGRHASWKLGHVHMMDERTGAVLCRL